MAYDWYGTGRRSTGPRESDLKPHLRVDNQAPRRGDAESGHFWPRDRQAIRDVREKRARQASGDGSSADKTATGREEPYGRDKIWPRSFETGRLHQPETEDSHDHSERPLSHGGYRGVGPRNYTRSDDRILDDIYDRLTEDPDLDASDIEVRVSHGEVTLDGTVDSRTAKRLAEDDAEEVSGVMHCQNNLRVRGRIRTPSGTIERPS